MRKVNDKIPAARIGIRVTKEQYHTIYQHFCDSTHTYFESYLKSVLLEKPVTMYYRNKSLDELLAAMNQLKNGLLFIQTLFESLRETLQTQAPTMAVTRWSTRLDQACEMHRLKMEEIRLELITLFELCMQKSNGQKI